jgi:NitT/TauT family transport system substrate-binding protein
MPIRLSENFRALFYAPYYATMALGFYAREGVDVVLLPSAMPGVPVAGLRDGTIDIAWAGPMRVIKDRDQNRNSPLVCFAEMVGRDPFYLIGRPGAATSTGREFALSDLRSLRLATVAEVPTPWLCLQHDLRTLGIDPSALRRIADRPMEANLEALRNRDIDVIQVFEPYASMALREGIGEVIYAASSRGPTLYTTFIATREGIARHGNAFAGMVRAVGRTQAWLGERGADALAGIAAPFFPGIAPEILLDSLRQYHAAGLWSATTAVSRQGFTQLADSLRSGGFIDNVPRYEDCVADVT